MLVHQWRHLSLACLLLFLPRVTQAKLDLTRTYLFRDLPNGESAEPIVEHHDETVDHGNRKDVVMPEFLLQEAPYHRVILFYSPQCPHCIHFQPTYVEFARHFRNLTRQDTFYAGIDVKFFAISCITYKKICQRQKITKYPILKAFHATQKQEYIIPSADLHPMTVLKALGTTVVNDKWGKTNYDTVQKQPQSKTQNATAGSYYSNPRSQAQLYGDAYLTFYNAMKDSVFLEPGPLPTIRRNALRQFLVLLQRTLPPWRLNWLVNELLDDFNDNTETEDMWNSILQTFPPPQPHWSPACQQHESPYTCGLWTLLHIMTVGVVEYNRQIPESQLLNKAKFAVQSPPTAALMLREYIHHFFLCEECSTHFVQAFDACEYNRCQRLKEEHPSLMEWQELPLWLLEFHNGVNRRLQAEGFQRQGREQAATVDEQEAVMWPPAKECPTCWIHPMKGAASHSNSTMMYRYIRLIYWPLDGETLDLQRDLKEARIVFEKQQHTLQHRRSVMHVAQEGAQQQLELTDEVVQVEAPYLVVSASVCGVWLIVMWKKYHMDRLLGIHRTKMRTV